MTISSISTAYLGTVMLSAVQQTQSQLTTAKGIVAADWATEVSAH